MDNEEKTKLYISKTLRIVLGVVAFAGLLSVAMVAPNVVQIIKSFNKKNKRYEYNFERKIPQALKILKEKGLVVIRKKEEGGFVELTEKGKGIVEKIKIGEMKIKKPPKWDGLWRVVIFDIKESRRRARDLFRLQIRNLGFKQIQKSIWVYPYPCEEVIKLFKSDLFIGKDILYIKAKEIENDDWLKREFGLY